MYHYSHVTIELKRKYCKYCLFINHNTHDFFLFHKRLIHYQIYICRVVRELNLNLPKSPCEAFGWTCYVCLCTVYHVLYL